MKYSHTQTIALKYAELMRAYPVDSRVDNVRNNDPVLIERVALGS